MNKEIYLQSEQVLEMESIIGFTPYFERMSGTIGWSSNESELLIYATPNWDTEGICPIEYYDDNGDGEHTYVGTISFVGRDIETQKKEYRDIITQIIQGFNEGW